MISSLSLSQLKHTAAGREEKVGITRCPNGQVHRTGKTPPGASRAVSTNLTGVEKIVERVEQSMDDIFCGCIDPVSISQLWVEAVIETQSEMSGLECFLPANATIPSNCICAELLATRQLLVPSQEDTKVCPIFPENTWLCPEESLLSSRLTLPSAWMRSMFQDASSNTYSNDSLLPSPLPWRQPWVPAHGLEQSNPSPERRGYETELCNDTAWAQLIVVKAFCWLHSSLICRRTKLSYAVTTLFNTGAITKPKNRKQRNLLERAELCTHAWDGSAPRMEGGEEGSLDSLNVAHVLYEKCFTVLCDIVTLQLCDARRSGAEPSEEQDLLST